MDTRKKKTLTAEYGRLVDDRFLGKWNSAKAARLDEINAALDEMDAPKIQALRMELETMEQKIAAIEAKIKEHGPHRPQTKTAGAP